jgi:hypothetical protein
MYGIEFDGLRLSKGLGTSAGVFSKKSDSVKLKLTFNQVLKFKREIRIWVRSK